MGCGSSKSGGEGTGNVKERKQSVFEPNIPVIPMNIGENVALTGPSTTKIICIFGGPGSGKGRTVANLRSMFGMKLLTTENIVLKHLPKKVRHAMTIEGTEEMAALVRKDPSHVTLEWVVRLVQHMVESDPEQTFIIDLMPNLRWLVRNEHLIKECSKELAAFEERTPISFAIHLSLTEDSLDQTLDYSHNHHTPSPQPAQATVADEADNSRAKRRYQMHEKGVQPFLDYFRASKRLVTVDVSSGAMDPIWDKVHEFFTSINLQAWRPVDTVLVFAMEGLKVGNMDLASCDMQLITLRDITTDPNASVEELLEVLSEHIDSLADASHYFVVDPTDTTIVSAASKGGGVGGGARLAKRAIVFSDWRDHAEGCVNKFSLRLNNLIGGDKPYFKAVCSNEDETLLFPASTDDDFCSQMALCMAEKHPSKK